MGLVRIPSWNFVHTEFIIVYKCYHDHPPDELGLDLLDGVLGDLVGGGYQLLVVLHRAALLALFFKMFNNEVLARIGVWFDSEMASVTKPVRISKPGILSVTVNSYISALKNCPSVIYSRTVSRTFELGQDIEALQPAISVIDANSGSIPI